MNWRQATVWLLAGLPLAQAAEVPAELFPKPDPAGTYAEMKTIGPDGRVWRTPVEDWAGARRRVAEDPAWRDWFAQQRTELDDWIAHRHDRVEWVAGWWHEFVSPKDSSFLIWTPQIPGEEVATFASKSDPSVPVTPTLFRAWVVTFRGRHMSMIQNAAIVWRITGDDRYADWAAAQLDFYAENLERWPVQDRFYGPSRLFGQPLMDAINLGKLVETARLVWDHVTPARRQAWFDHLFKPEALLINQSMHRIHNIACWLRSATAQVALLYDDRELWDFAVDGPWGLRQQIARGVTSDYIWFEQSSGYNQFTLMALTPFFVSAGLHGRGAEFAREMAIAENIALAPTWLRFSDNSVPNPADTTVNYPHEAPLKASLQRIYRVLPTPIGLREATDVKSWDTLVVPPPAPPAVMPPLPVVRSHDYHSTRFAVLRADGWQVFFHYGQLTGSHAQCEALNFEAFYGKTDVTHDSYTVGYGSPLHRGYFTRGLAHNVPLVDGEGEEKPALDQDPATLPQRGRLLAFDADQAVMAAAQPAYRPDASAERRLEIVDGKLIDDVKVTAADGASRRLGLALHVQGTVAVPERFAPMEDFAKDRPEPFGYWQNVRAADGEDRVSFDVTYASGLRLRVTIAVPGKFRVFTGSAPDSPVPNRCDGFYVETVGKSAVFHTEFEPLSDEADRLPTKLTK